MKLSWARHELFALCRSGTGLARAWPQHARDVQVLLTIVAASATVQDLSRLRCLRLVVDEALNPRNAPSVSVHYNEIELKGTLVNSQGNPLIVRPAASASPWWWQVGAIRVDSLAVRGRQALRVTG
ncbi:MAG TPA: hypothetical protein VMO88_13955, partial [Acidimicrobiales bacterium]|nr:hypothetical protein [Acidimicrobiales bacterium]